MTFWIAITTLNIIALIASLFASRELDRASRAIELASSAIKIAFSSRSDLADSDALMRELSSLRNHSSARGSFPLSFVQTFCAMFKRTCSSPKASSFSKNSDSFICGTETPNAKLTSPPQDSKDSEPPQFGGSG
jgi:hypothetical protein